MKKILSLLALLMTTVVAMATDYNDALSFKLSAYTHSLEEGTAVIEQNGETYNVTLQGCDFSTEMGGSDYNFGNLVFTGLYGETEDGVTTIIVENPAASLSSFATATIKGNLEVKFNDEKAYVSFVGTNKLFYQSMAFTATFGTDEGWSGGGDQPVIEGNPIAELTDYSPNGSKFSFPFTCDFTKQKLVWDVDFTNAGWTSNQLVFTIGTSDADLSKWETETGGNAHFYYTKSNSEGGKLVFHYLHKGKRNDVENIAVENVTKFTLDAEGFHVGETLVVPAEKMPKLYEGGTEFLFGSQEGSGRSYVTYNYVTVVDLTETPDPDPDPEPTEVDLAEANYNPAGHVFSFHGPINWDTQKFVTSMDLSTCTCTKSDNEGVLVFGNDDYTWGGTEGSVFSFFSISRGNQLNVYATASDGNVAVKVDVTQPVKVEVSKAGGMTINGEQVYAPEKLTNIFTYTDFYVGSDQGTQVSNATYKYMKIVPLDWTESETPVAKEYTGTWNVVRKGYEDMESVEDAKVSILLKDENTAQVTIPTFSDQDEGTEGTVGPLTFDVTYGYAVKGDQQSMIFSCGDEKVEMTNGDWNGYSASVSMDGELVDDKLTAKFNIVLGEMESYTYELGFNCEPFVAITVPYTDVANVTFGGKTTDFDKATVDLKEYEEDKFSITYKDVTLNGNNIGDLTIENITSTLDETTKVATLATTSTTATWTRVTENNALGVSAGDEVGIHNFEGTATPSEDEESEDFGSLKFKFGFNVQGEWADVVFGEKSTPTVVTEKTFTDAISMVSDEVSVELGQATVTVKEMSDETINMNLSVATEEGTTEYTASGFTKTVDAENNRTTYTGTLSIEEDEFNVNALVYTKDADEKLYMVAKGSYFNYVVGTDPDATTTEVSNKSYTSNLRVYDADATEQVNVVEKDEAVVNIVKYSDNTYKVTLKDIAWGENAATDLVFVGSADAGVMTDKLDGEEETEQGVSIMATPDEATAAVLGEGVQAMFQWTDKSEDAIEMAFYLQIGTTTYAGEFNYEKKEPVEEYAINFDKDAKNNHASRRTTYVSLQQEGKDVQTLTFNSSSNGYEDHSADKEFTVEAGSEVATTFGYNGEWMHGYVYIDLDNNKQFDVDADDLSNSPELVAYSYYKDLNSKGESVSANVNVTPPTFTAPTTPGTYRIRFKIDWDNVDPGGCVTSGNHILNNGGGIWDATLVVTDPVVDGISNINAAAAAGEADLYTVNGVKVNKLQKGLNIVRTADGKTVKVVVK